MVVGPGWLRGSFHALPDSECQELLDSVNVGRIGFWTPEGPCVLPVNYVTAHGSILFRTSPYTSIAQHVDGKVVAFEVDDVDYFSESGWSVLVRGVAEVVLGPSAVPGPPDPWPEGARSVVVRVRTASVSGRRVMGH